MANYSLDIVSEYDKAEMNNIFAGVQKALQGRYDFRNTKAEIDWLDNKGGIKVTGDNQWQVDAIIDIIRKQLAKRSLSSKLLDLSKRPDESNMKVTLDIPFKSGIDQDKAKFISKEIRNNFKKAKPQIQGQEIRVTSPSKDELQAIIQHTKNLDIDLHLDFVNFR